MKFWGKYGHLSSLDAAIQSLKDLEEEFLSKTFYDICDNSVALDERFDDMRLLRMVEGLQWVVLKNGGNLLFSKLPNLTIRSKQRI